ncbi:MAG: hypothetical protein AAF141_14405 [Pseudomonadota bacterium]
MTVRLEALRERAIAQKKKFRLRIIRNVLVVLGVFGALLAWVQVTTTHESDQFLVGQLMQEARGIESEIATIRQSQFRLPEFCTDADELTACQAQKDALGKELGDLTVRLEMAHFQLAQKGVLTKRDDGRSGFTFQKPHTESEGEAANWANISAIAKLATLPFLALVLAWMLDVPMRIYNRYDAWEFALLAFETDEELKAAVVTNGLLVEKLLTIADK